MNSSPSSDVRNCLRRAHQAGVTLWVEDMQLRYRCPEAKLTPELRHLLAQYKAEIVQILLDPKGPSLQPGGRKPKLKPEYPSLPQKSPFPMPEATWRRLFGSHELQNLSSITKSVRGSFSIQGDLNLPVLGDAVKALAAKHDLLNAHISINDGKAWCVYNDIDVLDRDFACLNPVQITDRAKAVEILDDITIDMACSLADIRVFSLSPSQHTVHVALHLAIADAAAVRIVVADLKRAYEAGCAGGVPQLARPVQMAEYISGSRLWMETPPGQRSLAFWSRQLENYRSMAWPGEGQQVNNQPTTTTLTFVLDGALRRSLATFARRVDLRPSALFLAAQAMAIEARRPSAPMWIDCADTAREDPVLKDVVGNLSYNVPLRLEPCGGTAAGMLVEVRAAIKKAKSNILPMGAYDDLIQELGLSWDTPWFKYVSQGRRTAPEFVKSEVKGASSMRIYCLEILEYADSTVSKLTYSTDRFREGAMVEFWSEIVDGLSHLMDVGI